MTDEQQAQWLVRSLLVFSAMPVERAYIYFFNDDDKASLHASSGLTRNFQPKPSFHAVAHLQRTLGEYRFSRMVKNEADTLRVQEYVHGSDTKKVLWAVWVPSGGNQRRQVTLEKTPGKLTGATKMVLTEKTKEIALPAQEERSGDVSVSVDGSVVYLSFEKK